MTIITCILTSILIGGLIPLSIALLAMEIHWVALCPLLIYILIHIYFLYILIELAETSALSSNKEKSFDNIVYYTGHEDIDDGIIMATETFPSLVPVIVISKPRLATPAPESFEVPTSDDE